MGERDIGEKEREIQGRKRERYRGEREGETVEKENNYKHKKIHGILCCRASIWLPWLNIHLCLSIIYANEI